MKCIIETDTLALMAVHKAPYSRSPPAKVTIEESPSGFYVTTLVDGQSRSMHFDRVAEFLVWAASFFGND